MPSQRNILPILLLGRTVRNIGTITVGPVTVTMAPNKKAISQLIPRAKCAKGAAITQVTNAP